MMTRRGSGNPADEYLPMLRPLGSERSEPPLEDLRHPVLMVVRIDLRRFPSATWVGARPQRPARLLDPKIFRVTPDAGQARDIGIHRDNITKQGMTDQEVVDQFTLTLKNPGEPLSASEPWSPSCATPCSADA